MSIEKQKIFLIIKKKDTEHELKLIPRKQIKKKKSKQNKQKTGTKNILKICSQVIKETAYRNIEFTSNKRNCLQKY